MTSHSPDFSRDELRRQLVESQREHEQALPQWREALHRVFDPAQGHDADTKARLLGLPDRRGFLRVGGATLAFSAVLAACGSKKEQTPITGTTPTSATGTPSIFDQGQELDLNLLRTAQSIEVLAVDAYQKAIDSGLLTTAAVADTAKLFQSQHQDHAGLLARATEDNGGQPYTEPNPYIVEKVSGPAIAALTDEASVIALALLLENTAAQTYVFAAELLATPELRQAIMSIGGTEARHVAVLYGVQQQPQVPFAFMPRRDHVDEKAFVGAGDYTPTSTTTTTEAAAGTTGTTAKSSGTTVTTKAG